MKYVLLCLLLAAGCGESTAVECEDWEGNFHPCSDSNADYACVYDEQGEQRNCYFVQY